MARVGPDGVLDPAAARVVSKGASAHPDVVRLGDATAIVYEAPGWSRGGFWAARLRTDGGIDDVWLAVEGDLRLPAIAAAPDRTLVVGLDIAQVGGSMKSIRGTIWHAW